MFILHGIFCEVTKKIIVAFFVYCALQNKEFIGVPFADRSLTLLFVLYLYWERTEIHALSNKLRTVQ